MTNKIFPLKDRYGNTINTVYIDNGDGTYTLATSSSGGGGGGAVTVADGADVTQGAKADSAANNSTSSWSAIALLKGLYAALVAPLPAGTNAIGSVTANPYAGTITATVVTLTAATSATLIASNSTRKGLRWQNIGANPATVVPGGSAAVVGNGPNYNGPPQGTGFQGGGESFEGAAVPTNAFQAISTGGTTIIVWEQT